MEVRDGWRRVHPEQPLGGPDGCRTRQHRGGGLKSTTGGCRGASSAWNGPKLVGGDPITPHPLVRSRLPRHAATARLVSERHAAVCNRRRLRTDVSTGGGGRIASATDSIDRDECGLLAGDCAKWSGTVPWGRSPRPRVSRKNRAACFMRMNNGATDFLLIAEFCRLENVSDAGLLARLKQRFPDVYAKYGGENFNETTAVDVEARAEAKCLSRPYRGSGPFGVIRRCLLRPVRLLDACFQVVSFGCKAVRARRARLARV
eukprot:scaffold7159_cov61-Phaeocystis_antarctica.AAC.2